MCFVAHGPATEIPNALAGHHVDVARHIVWASYCLYSTLVCAKYSSENYMQKSD